MVEIGLAVFVVVEEIYNKINDLGIETISAIIRYILLHTSEESFVYPYD